MPTPSRVLIRLAASIPSLTRGGNWAGTLSNLTASQLIGMGFSTTSAISFLGTNQGLAFSTTSASYFLSQNQGAGFATTSAAYFVSSSTTIPKTYTSNTFTGSNTFNGSLTAGSTFSIGSLNGPLQANNGVVSATTSVGVLYGGTGWTNILSGALLYGNGAGALATTSAGTAGNVLALLNGVPTWTATTTFSTGLTYANGIVTLNTAGDWSGTLNSYSAAQLIGLGFSTTSATYFITNNQGLAFSTTSANYYLTNSQGLAFSTTSASYFLGQNSGSAFSTTSASYFTSQNQGLSFSTTSAVYFANASTTIPKTYTNNTFSGSNTFNGSLTAGSTFNIGSLNGPLQANNGMVSATTSVGVLYGGTGWTNILSGALLYDNGTGALATTSAGAAGNVLALLNGVPTWTATTTFGAGLTYNGSTVTLNTSGDWGGTLNGYSANQLIGLGFSTTSATYFISNNQGLAFSTTSANYYLANSQGLAFSTTSASYFLSQNQTSAFATTSADYWKSNRDFFSTTSASYFLGQNIGNSFSTTSAIYFANSSTTIAKTYSSNAFTGANTFNGSLTAGSTFNIGSLNGPLQANNGVVSATTSVGVLYGGTGLSTAPSYGQLLLGQLNGTYALVSTSSLGISGGSGTVSSGTQGQFAFYNANGTTVAATSSLFLAQSGMIGIGTTSPFSTLSVNGSGYFSSTLTAPIIDNGGQVYNVKAFGAKGDGVTDDTSAFQKALNALSSTGGTLAVPSGSYLIASDNLTIANHVVIQLENSTINLGTNQILITSGGAAIIGMGHDQENWSPSRIVYAGTSAAIQIKSSVLSTSVNGVRLENLEIDATGAAVTSPTAIGAAFYGTRELLLDHLAVYNFEAGKGLYFTGNGSGAGFGAASQIRMPYLSTNKVGIQADMSGGSQSTFGRIDGGTISVGVLTGATAINLQCESWQVTGTDVGAPIVISNGSNANNTLIMGTRHEMGATGIGITIGAGVTNTKIIAPQFISGTALLSDGGTNTEVIAADTNATSTLTGGLNIQSGSLVVQQGNGFVGIGTSTSAMNLSIAGSGGNVGASVYNTSGDTGFSLYRFAGAGGTNADWSWGTNASNICGANSSACLLNNGNSRVPLVIQSNGFIGIGTTTPSAQLTTTGTVQFANFGAGTLQTDANGNLSVSSDERLKNIQGTFTAGLAQLEQLSPILYKWKPETGYDASTTYAGFSAQNVQLAIPEAVGQDRNGYLTLQDRPLIAAAINAIKEIATLSDTFKTNLIAWLGSASNGLTDLFAVTFHGHLALFDEVDTATTNTGKLCITDNPTNSSPICLTKPQLAALLSQSTASNLPTSVTSSGTPQASNSGNSGNANSTPPVIIINGASPATIPTGTTYADLGATITAPQAGVNLGLTVVVDNATSTDGTVQIDTSKTGTHTILYSVTDPNGLTGSATRTVIVSAPQQTPPPANDNATTSPAANDNAAWSTSATSTGQ